MAINNVLVYLKINLTYVIKYFRSHILIVDKHTKIQIIMSFKNKFLLLTIINLVKIRQNKNSEDIDMFFLISSKNLKCKCDYSTEPELCYDSKFLKKKIDLIDLNIKINNSVPVIIGALSLGQPLDVCRDLYFDIEIEDPLSNYALDLCDIVKTENKNSYKYYISVKLDYAEIHKNYASYLIKLIRFFNESRKKCDLKNWFLILDIRSDNLYKLVEESFNILHEQLKESDMKFLCCIGVYDYWILFQLRNFCQDICIIIHQYTSLANIVENINKLNLGYSNKVLIYGPNSIHNVYHLNLEIIKILYGINHFIVLNNEENDWDNSAIPFITNFMSSLYSQQENRQVQAFFEDSNNGILIRQSIFNAIICLWLEYRPRIPESLIDFDHPVYLRLVFDAKPFGVYSYFDLEDIESAFSCFYAIKTVTKK
ncbi:hypothetical protein HZS_5130 [Henneguya salminicola]|nr:hypothetical protein HZS_5130 [Henneguya salminicola]